MAVKDKTAVNAENIQAINTVTFKQKMLQYKNHPSSLVLLILVILCAVITVGALLFLIAYILVQGIPNLTPELFSLEYTSENASLMPALLNTVLITAISLVIAVPLGIFAAIYLVEYAKKGQQACVYGKNDGRNPFWYTVYCLRLVWYAVFCNYTGLGQLAYCRLLYAGYYDTAAYNAYYRRGS